MRTLKQTTAVMGGKMNLRNEKSLRKLCTNPDLPSME